MCLHVPVHEPMSFVFPGKRVTQFSEVCSQTTKIEVWLYGVLPVEAHAQSCVYILVPTRIFIYFKIFSFGRIVCSHQGKSTSEDKLSI